MTVAVVRTVPVVAVRDRHMPAALTVDVVMTGMLVMSGGPALVHAAFVLAAQMTVVHVIDVIVVRDRHMPTAFAVRGRCQPPNVRRSSMPPRERGSAG